MRTPIGIAGVVAALSVTSDLTRGHPQGEAMRACLLATELARRAGLADRDRGVVYYTTLLRFAGCSATSHEAAAVFGGDDIAVRARGDLTDLSDPEEAMAILVGLGVDAARLRMLGGPPGLARIYEASTRADCEVGAELTRRLRLPAEVEAAVLDGFERYDGQGAPEGKAGPDVAAAARFAAVGYAAVMFDAVGGPPVAHETVARWSGRALDPAITAVFLDAPAELLEISDPDELWAAVVDVEPGPPRTFHDDAALDEALGGFGDAADLKSPCFQGHSRGVAALARTAAYGTAADPGLVHRAALVHDLGRVAIPTGIWERPGPLRPQEWELVRLHPYLSGRILAASPVLAPLGAVASRHHERVDGSGYPAGVRGAELGAEDCLLAAADAFHALGEARPHRPAMDARSAARVLSRMPLTRQAIRAVLEAAHVTAPVLPPLPASLTERELDVLRLLACGRTQREIASALVVSPSTVHTHTAHIYDKCGVSTRAGLAMFAMRHGLVTPG
ncbi:MAG TPA: HD domain-containing phosphohydrolase [Intrasporangium sp.]|uniref:HD domain-containing phosphohydrolase n=1 Tax=Intrasporangium sp. TaxID=1925024 RepID=UPI002D77AAF9|nr:HD domain-containing phosphohydrolase [Intrasporangium sp.]HET7399852.1 HD domain-containing phosphohydrolase [Intrasporangium sp.]